MTLGARTSSMVEGVGGFYYPLRPTDQRSLRRTVRYWKLLFISPKIRVVFCPYSYARGIIHIRKHAIKLLIEMQRETLQSMARRSKGSVRRRSEVSRLCFISYLIIIILTLNVDCVLCERRFVVGGEEESLGALGSEALTPFRSLYLAYRCNNSF